jgi:glycine cleavage system H protein
VEVNARLDGEPALVNSDPYGDGWMLRLRIDPASRAALLSAAQYAAHLGG